LRITGEADGARFPIHFPCSTRRARAEEYILTQYHFAALVLIAIGPLLALSRLIRMPESLLLFAMGLLSAFIPGLPEPNIDLDLILTLFLPPLIYASTVRVSWHLLRFTLLPGVVLGTILVLTTIGAVALAARTVFLPGLSWTAALLIGIVASIFDTRLFHEAEGRPRVPRAIADTLKARELVGRIFILATLSVVEEVLSSGEVATSSVLASYGLDIPAGALIGLAVGHGAVWMRRRIDPAPVEIAISIATPYAAALSAEAAGFSVVTAVIVTALVVSAIRVDRHSGATISSSEARVSAVAFWDQANLMVSSALFLLAGRAVPQALAALEVWSIWRLFLAAAGLLALVLSIQVCFSYTAAKLPPIAGALQRWQGEGRSQLAAAGVMAWSSTRSVIALLIALSVPAVIPTGEPVQDRDLVLILAAFIVIGSVVVQGLSLRSLVEFAALSDPGEADQEVEEARSAMRKASEAPGAEHASSHDAARQVLVSLRERDVIGDEVLVRMLRETDLHARAAEENALPGTGPPQP
jgi:NhaP-type Na+/H+ or K+/H+ antiporter